MQRKKDELVLLELTVLLLLLLLAQWLAKGAADENGAKKEADKT